MGEVTDLIAGVPVSDLDASTDWYRRFFGREPDLVAGDEILWDVRPGATLFIEPNPAAAGSGHVTFAVTGLDELLEQLNAAGIKHEPIETYDNGVRHVSIPDPDGNLIAYAEVATAAPGNNRSGHQPDWPQSPAVGRHEPPPSAASGTS